MGQWWLINLEGLINPVFTLFYILKTYLSSHIVVKIWVWDYIYISIYLYASVKKRLFCVERLLCKSSSV